MQLEGYLFFFSQEMTPNKALIICCPKTILTSTGVFFVCYKRPFHCFLTVHNVTNVTDWKPIFTSVFSHICSMNHFLDNEQTYDRLARARHTFHLCHSGWFKLPAAIDVSWLDARPFYCAICRWFISQRDFRIIVCKYNTFKWYNRYPHYNTTYKQNY